MGLTPRVVLVLDPRPGAESADQLRLPDGVLLIDAVGVRAVHEGGRIVALATGGPELSQALATLGSDSDTDPVCVVDGAALALPTTYGDLVTDPRREPAVLEDGQQQVVGIRLDGPDLIGPAAGATDSVCSLLVAAAREAAPGESLAEVGRVLTMTTAATTRPARRVVAGPFPLLMVTGQPDLAEGLRAEADVDEPGLRLRRASRADDGFLSTFLIRPLSRQVTRRAVALGWRPAAITATSGVIGLLSAGSYALAGVGPPLLWRLIGSILLLGSLVIDCVDGEVARYTRTFSPLGGWLDVGCDRVKEYAIYAGLAAGARPTAWVWASAAFAILVVRHFVDFGYAATVSAETGAAQTTTDPVAAWSERTSRRPALLWLKRAVVMPVGERTIALAVLAPVVGPRWTLGLLFAAGCVSAVYTLAGRVGRRMRARGSARWVWLLPALARAIEVVGIVVLVRQHRPAALAAAYAVLAVVALHEYDVVYRRRLTGAGSAQRVRSAADRLSWPIRVVVLVALIVVLGHPVIDVLFVLAALGLVLALADSVVWWRRFVRSAWPREVHGA